MKRAGNTQKRGFGNTSQEKGVIKQKNNRIRDEKDVVVSTRQALVYAGFIGVFVMAYCFTGALFLGVAYTQKIIDWWVLLGHAISGFMIPYYNYLIKRERSKVSEYEAVKII